MTTARKLWLGIGTIGTISVLVVVPLCFWLLALEREVRYVTTVSTPLGDAARELEINVNGLGLAVTIYLHTRAPESWDRVEEDTDDFRRFLAQYRQLATDPRQLELSGRLENLFAEYQNLAIRLMRQKDSGEPVVTDLERFAELRAQLDHVLDNELQAVNIDEVKSVQEQAHSKVQGIVTAALFLLGGGLLTAMVTSIVVGRGLLKVEENLRVTLQCIGDGVVVTDVDGRVTTLNPIAETLTGWTEDQAIGQPLEQVFRIINEQSRAPVNNPVQKVLESGKIVGLANHTLLIAQDGTERPIDDSAAPIVDSDGRMTGVVLVFRDVTERRKTERTLRESEARKTAMLETALDAIVTIDEEGRIVEFNPAAERLFGRGRHEVLGQKIMELIIPPSSRKQHQEGLDKLLTTDKVRWLGQRLELTALRADGTEFPVELAITRIQQAGRTLFTGYFRDITHVKRVEKQSDLLRTISENATSALFMVDAQGYCTYMNTAAETMTGFTFDEIRQKPLHDMIHHTRPDGRPYPADKCPIDRALPKNAQVRMHEDVFIRKNGEFFPVLCAASPVFEDGGPVATVVEVRDVTEEKQIRDELHTANRRKDELLATLAHELRNPLAPISNGLDVLALVANDPEQTAQILEVMERQVQQMVHLIDDLLDVSRISRGKIELRLQRIDLNDIVRQAVESASPLVEESGHSLTVDGVESPLIMNSDPVRLTQVFSNLLTNACKYTQPGGRIQIVTQRFGSDAIVRVRDNGAGIPAERLSDIFEMFCQAHGELDSSRSGLGLGLTLVKTLVELHGGSVTAHSEGSGKGSEFVVRLPLLIENRSQTDTLQPSTTPAAAQPRRVLVVEDTKAIAEVFARLLRVMGHEVRVAYNGAAAIEQVRIYRPDVVFSDISMPGMNGYELAKELRRLPEAQETVLVAMTGYGQTEDREKALQHGFHHHMVKPADIRELETFFQSLHKRPSAV